MPTSLVDIFSEVQSCDKTSEEMTVDEYLNSNHPSISAILRENSTVQQFEFRNVETAEILSILKSLDPKKATGHDTIPARPLRYCATIIASALAVLINKLITSAYVPVDCKLAELCPVFKKDDVLESKIQTCVYSCSTGQDGSDTPPNRDQRMPTSDVTIGARGAG